MTLKYRLATAAICACSMSANAATINMGDTGKLEVKADAFAKIYHNDGAGRNAFSFPYDKGAQSRFRLGLSLSNDSDWSLHTRLLGFYNWAGDRRQSTGAGSNYSSDLNSDSLSLDLAFIEYTGIDTWSIRVGRQAATWGYGFTIADDRRDRILARQITPLDKGFLGFMAIYDLRFSTDHYDASALHQNTGNNYSDDLHGINVLMFGKYDGLDWGVNATYMNGADSVAKPITNPYGIEDFYLLAPYASKTFDKISLKGAANIMFSNSDDDGITNAWGNNSLAAFVEAGYQFTPEFQLQAQVGAFVDGGMVGRSWDSYSLLLNNNPRNNNNPAFVGQFGGFGKISYETGQLYAVRANWNSSEKLKFTFAAGQMNMEGWTGSEIETTFYDVKALYMFDANHSIELRAGHADGDVDATSFLTTVKVSFN